MVVDERCWFIIFFTLNLLSYMLCRSGMLIETDVGRFTKCGGPFWQDINSGSDNHVLRPLTFGFCLYNTNIPIDHHHTSSNTPPLLFHPLAAHTVRMLHSPAVHRLLSYFCTVDFICCLLSLARVLSLSTPTPSLPNLGVSGLLSLCHSGLRAIPTPCDSNPPVDQ